MKGQMEKSEALRAESHNTVEKLRKEFDNLVREFANYKRAEGNKHNVKKQSKGNIPHDIGTHKPMDIDRNLSHVLAEGGSYHPKRNDNKKESGVKHKARENYDDVEEMDLDASGGNKDDGQNNNERNNQPFVPLLSLGKIGDK